MDVQSPGPSLLDYVISFNILPICRIFHIVSDIFSISDNIFITFHKQCLGSKQKPR